MRIETEDGTAVTQPTWVVLTRDEAAMLHAALEFYFEEDPADPGWHHHVGEGDSQLTVAIEVEQ